MPFQVPLIVGIIALFVCIGVWTKTKRIGPVIGAALAAFVVMAVSDPAFLNAGKDLMVSIFLWAKGIFRG